LALSIEAFSPKGATAEILEDVDRASRRSIGTVPLNGDDLADRLQLGIAEIDRRLGWVLESDIDLDVCGASRRGERNLFKLSLKNWFTE
jgi:hypothetical protein